MGSISWELPLIFLMGFMGIDAGFMGSTGILLMRFLASGQHFLKNEVEKHHLSIIGKSAISMGHVQ